MIIVFFISGLVLKTEDLKKALAHKLGVVYGFLAIILVTPMLGFLFNQIPLQPKEFAVGKRRARSHAPPPAMPCTPSSSRQASCGVVAWIERQTQKHKQSSHAAGTHRNAAGGQGCKAVPDMPTGQKCSFHSALSRVLGQVRGRSLAGPPPGQPYLLNCPEAPPMLLASTP